MAEIVTTNTTHQHATPSSGDTVVFSRSARHLFFVVTGGTAQVAIGSDGSDGYLTLPVGYHEMYNAHAKFVTVGAASTLEILGVSL